MKCFDILGPEAEFHHIGLAMPSISQVFNDEIDIISDSLQKVSVAFINFHGLCIELIEPLTDQSPVTNSLKKGHKLVHLCFKVKDIEAATEKSRKHGFHLIAKPVPAEAFDGKKIAWLYSKQFGLLELLED